ncbi:MAG: MFS transporter [Alphaproteobacteria bacterium]|nr:MFS transporter [Alphaproteobacteria bacterium]
MTNTPNLPPLSKGALAAYGSLAFPLAFAGIPLYVLAPDFYAAEYAVPLAALAGVLLLTRLFDAVQDPLIGFLSDRFAARRGVVISCGFVLFTLGFALLFHPLAAAPLAWFALCMVVAATGFSVLAINLGALGSLWRRAPVEKARITAMREAIGLCGLILAIMLPGLFQQSLTIKESFSVYALIFLVAALACGAVFRLWLSGATFDEKPAEAQSADRWPHKVVKTRDGLFYVVYFLSMLASALPAVLVVFYIRDYLAAESYLGGFLLLYFLAGLAGMPLWRAAAARFGAGPVWAAAMLFAGVVFAGAVAIPPAGAIGFYALVCVASGLALGAELSLPPAFLSSVIDRRRAGAQTAGCFALMSFLMKLALAIAGAGGLYALDLAGFAPRADNGAAALARLSFLYALLPAFLKIAAAILMMFYLFKSDKEEFHEKTVGIDRIGGGYGARRM